MSTGVSTLELLYGVLPRVGVAEGSILSRQIELVNDDARCVELLSAEEMPAWRSWTTRKDFVESLLVVGDHVLVVRGEDVCQVKWILMKSMFYGPCAVNYAENPRYKLKSPHGRVSRRPIHTRRLVRYYHRPRNQGMD